MKLPLITDKQYNIGHICTALQCERGAGKKVAMRWIPPKGPPNDFTFSDINHASNRFANLLHQLDLGPGDIFFTFLPKTPEQFAAILGALKARVICGTLFANFGEEALFDRLADSRAKAILTKKALTPRINRIREKLPYLKHILTIDGTGRDPDGSVGLVDILPSISDEYSPSTTAPNTPSLLHYTSGSTGKPKGVLHCHGSVVCQEATTREVLSLNENDVYWCTADQGWVTGTSYGIIGPWSLGVTQIHYGGAYSAERWAEVLLNEKVTTWYSAPTAFRMLMREDPRIFHGLKDSPLRNIFSVGEPLNPEVIAWSRRVLGKDIYDTWFQTETGAIMIANRPGLTIRPGSMGKPVNGITAAIIGKNSKRLPPGTHGDLCLEPGWPSMFTAYLNNAATYKRRFRAGWYHTNDTAKMDSDGYFWFDGRSDDIINTAGHLISPFEVESALLELPEIAESGVVGAPDKVLFEKVIAFIQLHKGVSPSSELELKIRMYISNKVSTIATPQNIIFCDSIPKNKSGKIMRRVLKARYDGTSAGDTSTMETNS